MDAEGMALDLDPVDPDSPDIDTSDDDSESDSDMEHIDHHNADDDVHDDGIQENQDIKLEIAPVSTSTSATSNIKLEAKGADSTDRPMHYHRHQYKDREQMSTGGNQNQNYLYHDHRNTRTRIHYYDNRFRYSRRQRSDYEINRTLWVGNIPMWTKDTQLVKLFSEIGEVRQISIPKSLPTRSVTKFGFITFHKEESVPKALEQLRGTTFFGRVLRLAAKRGSVHEAKDLELEKIQEEDLANKIRSRKEELEEVRDLAKRRMAVKEPTGTGHDCDDSGTDSFSSYLQNPSKHGLQAQSLFERNAKAFEQKQRQMAFSMSLDLEPPNMNGIWHSHYPDTDFHLIENPAKRPRQFSPPRKQSHSNYTAGSPSASHHLPDSTASIYSNGSRGKYSDVACGSGAMRGPSYYNNEVMVSRDKAVNKRDFKRKPSKPDYYCQKEKYSRSLEVGSTMNMNMPGNGGSDNMPCGSLYKPADDDDASTSSISEDDTLGNQGTISDTETGSTPSQTSNASTDNSQSVAAMQKFIIENFEALRNAALTLPEHANVSVNQKDMKIRVTKTLKKSKQKPEDDGGKIAKKSEEKTICRIM